MEKETIQGIKDSIELFASMFTAFVAYKALISWKHQKNHEILMQGISQYMKHNVFITNYSNNLLTLVNSFYNRTEGICEIRKEFYGNAEENNFISLFAMLKFTKTSDKNLQNVKELYSIYHDIVRDINTAISVLIKEGDDRILQFPKEEDIEQFKVQIRKLQRRINDTVTEYNEKLLECDQKNRNPLQEYGFKKLKIMKKTFETVWLYIRGILQRRASGRIFL